MKAPRQRQALGHRKALMEAIKPGALIMHRGRHSRTYVFTRMIDGASVRVSRELFHDAARERMIDGMLLMWACGMDQWERGGRQFDYDREAQAIRVLETEGVNA